MAHHLSAKKRIRQTAKRNLRNRMLRSSLRTCLKGFQTVLKEGNVDTIQGSYPAVQKQIDRAVTKGILHRNTAKRYKSRLSAAVAKNI